MKRFSRSIAFAAIALGAMATSLLAGQSGGADRDMSGSGQGLRRTENCLSTIELSFLPVELPQAIARAVTANRMRMPVA